MAASLISYCEGLFKTITADIDIDKASFKKLRLLVTEDKISQAKQEKFVKVAKFVSLDFILNDVKICFATHLDDGYLMLTGVSPSEFENIDLEEEGVYLEDINAGFLLYFTNVARLTRKQSLDEISLKENILYQQEDPLYRGHSYEDLLSCIEDFCVFKIAKNSIFQSKSGSEVAYYICSHMEKHIHLPFDDVLPKYKELLRNSYKLFKENIFLSLTSTHYKHAFLELYRCVELLYWVPRALSLKKAIDYKSSAYILAQHCNKELSWKYNERDALNGLFNLIDINILLNSKLQSCSFVTDPSIFFDKSNLIISKFSDLIYNIRNQLVHQFAVENEIIISQDDWTCLLLLLSNVVEDAYNKLSVELIP